MIKAISRHILEVSETGNKYFDRAWLIVNPQYMNCGADIIEAEAADYLHDLDAPYSMRHRNGFLVKAANFLFAAISGGLITAAFIQLY